MPKKNQDHWSLLNTFYWTGSHLEFTLDVSRMQLASDFVEIVADRLGTALDEMEALEKGAVANPDEGRMVGHYWLRAPDLAPTEDIRDAIVAAQKAVKDFVGQVHFGSIRGQTGKPFRNVLVMGIGGSILGPQLLASALSGPQDKMHLFWMDNTDPDGFYRLYRRLHHELDRTLCLVMSKSGRTLETMTAMEETKSAMKRVGLDFAKQAVVVTLPGSELAQRAEHEGWLATFPIWEWVGGRMSLFSAVGLLPAGLMGMDVDALVHGAARMDQATRSRTLRDNPAAMIAALWYHTVVENGLSQLVVEPYKDRLEPWSRYLQQLIMESLGKAVDRQGKPVHSGFTVYGNKGSTDQHSILQHLSEGPGGFFVEFLHVMRDLYGATWGSGGAFDTELEVRPDVSSGDCLLALLMGTREALSGKGRPNYSIWLERLDATTLGELVALHERAVGLYASMVDINAYNQPGVEASKKSAGRFLEQQRRALEVLVDQQPNRMTAIEVAKAVGKDGDVESIYLSLRHLAANSTRGVRRQAAARPMDEVFWWDRGVRDK
ncbi:MAG: glucose-6-phosphate isomerase [Deltaproteobacteria bacterium]|nr:glucose-6-phosphate isomerase [Deltaproteobacteria bacterium]